jgi:hypothetical protein
MQYASTIFTGFAAFFWLLAAIAKVKVPGQPGYVLTGSESGTGLVINGIDVLATARKQTKWNTLAASFACAAAVCQVVISIPHP